MPTKQGFWIVVEGIDGAGKTTAIHTVIEQLKLKTLTVQSYREPGGTAFGEAVRNILKTEGLGILPLAEVLLFYAARYQLLETQILPALDMGHCVVLDRHELSTFAYQSGGRGMDFATIKTISTLCLQGKKPDLIIYLSVEPKRAYERMLMRGSLDHIEKQDISFFENVANAYETLLLDYPNVLRIDANQPIASVQDELMVKLNQWLERH
jgi:dTMP kinase